MNGDFPMDRTPRENSAPARGEKKPLEGGSPVPERRKHPRFIVKLPVEYRRGDAGLFRPGHTVNFSEEGFMLSLGETLEIGEKLEMKIYFTSCSGLTAVAAVGKVVWADPLAGEDSFFRCGVRYALISAANRERLKSFLSLYADPSPSPADFPSQAGGFPPAARRPDDAEGPGRP